MLVYRERKTIRCIRIIMILLYALLESALSLRARWLMPTPRHFPSMLLLRFYRDIRAYALFLLSIEYAGFFFSCFSLLFFFIFLLWFHDIVFLFTCALFVSIKTRPPIYIDQIKRVNENTKQKKTALDFIHVWCGFSFVIVVIVKWNSVRSRNYVVKWMTNIHST